jgi:signal peptide peptidase SppA
MTETSSKIEFLRGVPIVGETLANALDGAPTVGVLRLSGIIGSSGMGRRTGLALAEQASSIERVFKLSRLKAVALAINSPGGSPVQSALLAGRIRQLAEENEIPVYAFCEDVAASGGYWLACAAEEIYADPASILGSIGVVSAGFGFTDMLEKIGVERRVHTSGEKKGMLDPFVPEVEDDLARLREIQEDIHEQFKDYVRKRRGTKLTASEDMLFSGEFWTGRRSQELGLIDGLGDLRSVMREKYGEKVNLHLVGGRKRFGLGRLLGGQADLVDQGIAALEDRAYWSRFGL